MFAMKASGQSAGYYPRVHAHPFLRTYTEVLLEGRLCSTFNVQHPSNPSFIDATMSCLW